ELQHTTSQPKACPTGPSHARATQRPRAAGAGARLASSSTATSVRARPDREAVVNSCGHNCCKEYNEDMQNVLNLVAEVERRDLSLSERAGGAGVARATVRRIAAGERGRPSTRRALRAALAQFEPVPEGFASPQPAASAEPAKPRPSAAALLAEAGVRDPWA